MIVLAAHDRSTDLEFKVKIQNDPSKKFTTISESSLPFINKATLLHFP